MCPWRDGGTRPAARPPRPAGSSFGGSTSYSIGNRWRPLRHWGDFPLLWDVTLHRLTENESPCRLDRISEVTRLVM